MEVMDKINEALKQTSRKDVIDESSDDKNPSFMWSRTNNILLLSILNGKFDPLEYAKREMVNRGIGKNGEFIGFEEAGKLWKPKVK